MIEKIEALRINVVRNGVYENNNNRKIPVEQCRGFVLVDELAHLWIGKSAGFDLIDFESSENEIERLCNKVAVEYLVPKRLFFEQWAVNPDIKNLSNFFKVSELVIIRRAYENNLIDRNKFLELLNGFKNASGLFTKSQTSGGSFYANNRYKIGLPFAYFIKYAVNSGTLLYQEAYTLTGLRGNTFEKFMSDL